jgi:hypothetical protein
LNLVYWDSGRGFTLAQCVVEGGRESEEQTTAGVQPHRHKYHHHQPATTAASVATLHWYRVSSLGGCVSSTRLVQTPTSTLIHTPLFDHQSEQQQPISIMSDHCSNLQRSMKAMESLSYLSIELALLQCSSSETSSSPCRQRRRSSRQHRLTMSSMCLLLAMSYLCIAAITCRQCHAFSSSSLQLSRRTPGQNHYTTPSSYNYQQSRFFMSAVADLPAQQHSSSQQPSSSSSEPTRLSDFQRRMKGLVNRNGAVVRREVEKPKNLKTVNTLGEYKEALDEERGKIVVVSRYAM